MNPVFSEFVGSNRQNHSTAFPLLVRDESEEEEEDEEEDGDKEEDSDEDEEDGNQDGYSE